MICVVLSLHSATPSKTKAMLSDPDSVKPGVQIVTRDQLKVGTHVLMMDGSDWRVAKVDTVSTDDGLVGVLLYAMPEYEDQPFRLGEKTLEGFGKNYWEYPLDCLKTILEEPFMKKTSARRIAYSFLELNKYLEKRVKL